MKLFYIVFSLLFTSGAFAAHTPFFQLYDCARERFISIRHETVADRIMFSVEKETRDNADFYTLKLKSLGKEDRGLRLTAFLPFARENACFLGGGYLRERAVPGKVHSFLFGGTPTSQKGVGFSRYPLAGITNGRTAVALAMDLSHPAFSRIEYDTDEERFSIHFEVGLIPEHPEAEVRFCVYEFRHDWGFRAALDRYYRLFPGDFEVRSRDQGLCLPFAEPSRIAGIDDFGIRYREIIYDGKWDYDRMSPDLRAMPRLRKEVEYGNRKNIASFRYHEPGTFWLPLKADFPRTYESALAYTKKLADSGHPQAKALFASGMKDADGRFHLSFSKEHWNNGCHWAISSLPGVQSEDKLYNVDFPREKLKSYQREDGSILAGEFYDSMGGYMRDPLDFSRSNMAAAKYPLVYDCLTGRVAASFLLCHTEYAGMSSGAIHEAGKMTAANNVRNFMLSRCFDVFVGEFYWKQASWKPMPPEGLFFIRAMTKGKPYTIFQKTAEKELSREEVQQYMRYAVAFGIFPGFFSDRVTGKNYFRSPGLYEQDRHLFRKYIPLCKKLSEAGWEPVTNVRADHPGILVERFGKSFFTVYNNTKELLAFTLRFEDRTIHRLKSWIAPETAFSGQNGIFEISLPGGGLQIFEVAEK